VPLSITEEHEQLRQAVRRWAADHAVARLARAVLDASIGGTPDPQGDGRSEGGDAQARVHGRVGGDPAASTSWWASLADQGWCGLPVPERAGGQGFGLLEAGVVAEALAEAGAPGHYLATVLGAALLSRSVAASWGASPPEPPEGGSGPAAARGPLAAIEPLVAAVAAGQRTATVALPGCGHLVEQPADGRPGDRHLTVHGALQPVLADRHVGVVVAPCHTDSGDDDQWIAVPVDQPGVHVEPIASLDPVRPVVALTVSGARAHRLPGLGTTAVLAAARCLAAADAAGGARWCTETAAAHARARRQFGRPIGQFQAVKHKVADMLVATEAATAAAWDALSAWDAQRADDERSADAVALSAAGAAAVALDAYQACAKTCIQVLGGMGFTWEHDAHVHLRRAAAMAALLNPATARREVAQRARAGTRRRLDSQLPPEAEELRSTIRPLVAAIAAAPADERRRLLVDHGLLAPHWPPPYGRGAGPVEQVVIDQELAAARLRRPTLAVGAWALPTLIAHGTPEQRDRWVRPTLLGELTWCQLFSEPEAGSDLASLRTRATKVPGGWQLDGQKVWTSLAAQADLGICLARTDPESRRHEGITYFVVDMHAGGIDVRPLRELTGDALFNEVFLDGVFVPDDHVVGPVGGGWALARTTLANERVQMSSGATFGAGVEALLAQWRASAPGDPATGDPVVADRIGALVAEAAALAALEARTARRALLGADGGPEASVRKLLGAEHEQRVHELGLSLLGPVGATLTADGERWGRGFLVTRCLTIAGGTSEIQRNVIAERLLGLPRDPEPPE